MSLLDSLTDALGGDNLQALGGVLGNGGLNSIIGRLQESGLAEAAASWVSSGPNKPVTFEQIQDALGPDTVRSLTSALGVQGNDLAQALPALVDKLTPGGNLSELSVQDIASHLGKADLGGLIGGALGGFLKS